MSQQNEHAAAEDTRPSESCQPEDNVRKFVVEGYKYLREHKDHELLNHKYLARVGNGCYVEFEPFPFDAGSVQLAFHGELIKASGNGDLLERTGNHFVVKVPQRTEGMERIDTIDRLYYLNGTAEKAMSRQRIVKGFISEFNRLKVSKKIRLNECSVAQIVQVPELADEDNAENSLVSLRRKLHLSAVLFRKSHVTVEAFIEGNFEKFVNNDGNYSARKTNLPGAFVHWTWERSRGSRMVCDIQGVRRVSEYVLTDPCVHSRKRLSSETKYGQTDLGKLGMVQFFMKHQCNNLCKDLGLQDVKESTNKMFDTAKMLTRTNDHAFISDMRFDISQHGRQKDAPKKASSSTTERFVSLKSVLEIEKQEADLLAKSKDSTTESTPKSSLKGESPASLHENLISSEKKEIEKMSQSPKISGDNSCKSQEKDDKHFSDSEKDAKETHIFKSESCDDSKRNDEALATDSLPENSDEILEDENDSSEEMSRNPIDLSSQKGSSPSFESPVPQDLTCNAEKTEIFKPLDTLLDETSDSSSTGNVSEVEVDGDDTKDTKESNDAQVDDSQDICDGSVYEDSEEIYNEQKLSENEKNQSSELDTHTKINPLIQENDGIADQIQESTSAKQIDSNEDENQAEMSHLFKSCSNNGASNENNIEDGMGSEFKKEVDCEENNEEKQDKVANGRNNLSDSIESIKETFTDLLKVANAADELKLMLENSIIEKQSQLQNSDTKSFKADETTEKSENLESTAMESTSNMKNETEACSNVDGKVSGLEEKKESNNVEGDNDESGNCEDLENEKEDMETVFNGTNISTAEDENQTGKTRERSEFENSNTVKDETDNLSTEFVETTSINVDNLNEDEKDKMEQIEHIDKNEKCTDNDEPRPETNTIDENTNEETNEGLLCTDTEQTAEARASKILCSEPASTPIDDATAPDLKDNDGVELENEFRDPESKTDTDSLIHEENMEPESDDEREQNNLEQNLNIEKTSGEDGTALQTRQSTIIGRNECTDSSTKSASMDVDSLEQENLASLAEVLQSEKERHTEAETCNCQAENSFKSSTTPKDDQVGHCSSPESDEKQKSNLLVSVSDEDRNISNSDDPDNQAESIQSLEDENQEQKRNESETDKVKSMDETAVEEPKSIEKDTSSITISSSIECAVENGHKAQSDPADKTLKEEKTVESEVCAEKDLQEQEKKNEHTNKNPKEEQILEQSNDSGFEDNISDVVQSMSSSKEIEVDSSSPKRAEEDLDLFNKVLSILKGNNTVGVLSSNLSFRAIAAENCPFSGFGEMALALNEQSDSEIITAETVRHKMLDQITISKRFVFIGKNYDAISDSHLREEIVQKILEGNQIGSFSEFVELTSLSDAFKARIVLHSATISEQIIQIQTDTKAEFSPCCLYPDLKTIRMAKISSEGESLFVALTSQIEKDE